MHSMAGRQLARSQTNKRIAGVCGGIAEYFDLDPTLVRVAFVLAALIGGPGVLVYIVLWIVLPKGPEGVGPPHMTGRRATSAIRIAEERFARGEISAEELSQIRSDLGG